MCRRRIRIELLADRVRWLARYRRWLAVGAAVVFAPLLVSQLVDALGTDWPQIHATALSLMLALMVWCVIEIALVGLTAWWETECDQLTRNQGLPRAIVRRRAPR